MSKFTDSVQQDTPRLVVEFRRGEGGQELFQWGIVAGADMPGMGLLGAVVRVQAELFFRAAEPCPQEALVIAWDAGRRAFDWYLHENIPLDSLAGMLEVVKTVLVHAHAAKQGQTGAGRTPLLGPDGQPMRRGI